MIRSGFWAFNKNKTHTISAYSSSDKFMIIYCNFTTQFSFLNKIHNTVGPTYKASKSCTSGSN